jgi:hypothetical protein
MNPYFFNLNYSILTEEEKTSIIDFAKVNDDQIKAFIPTVGPNVGKHDGNFYWPGSALNENNIIARLTETCKKAFIPFILKQLPNTSVYIHKDESPKRSCILVVPLAPTQNYAPTLFWENRDDKQPICSASFLNMNTTLMNTTKLHSLINTSNELRLNFQLAFSEPYEEIQQLLIENKLFN